MSSAVPARGDSTQPEWRAASTVALTSAAGAAPVRDRMTWPRAAVTSREAITVRTSWRTTATTATTVAPSPVATTTSPASATRVTAGATPMKEAAARPAVNARGDIACRAKCSGRRVSSPPPNRAGPTSQPAVQSASAAPSRSSRSDATG
ncbi:hypothetical protein [Nonomuraea sp. NPDC005501]|uniref:hypothetical protein n=1 Tax=Nonomuraea sp. NPDC005501 TaxID=3156884 RepID=UPI0033B571F5